MLVWNVRETTMNESNITSISDTLYSMPLSGTPDPLKNKKNARGHIFKGGRKRKFSMMIMILMKMM